MKQFIISSPDLDLINLVKQSFEIEKTWFAGKYTYSISNPDCDPVHSLYAEGDRVPLGDMWRFADGVSISYRLVNGKIKPKEDLTEISS